MQLYRSNINVNPKFNVNGAYNFQFSFWFMGSIVLSELGFVCLIYLYTVACGVQQPKNQLWQLSRAAAAANLPHP